MNNYKISLERQNQGIAKQSFLNIRRIVSLLGQALSATNREYTTGSIKRAVIFLSIPMILEMCGESVFAVVDIFFVGRVSTDAVAAVGLTESVLTIVYCVAMGISMSSTAIVARRVGENKPEEAARSSAQALIIGLLTTLVLTTAGLIFAPGILRFMGSSHEMLSSAVVFARISFGSTLAIMMLYVINGIFRGAGNASIAMWSLWIANGCNIILCPIMIHFYGLPGAAMATAIGRGIGVCYQTYHLITGKGVIRLKKAFFLPDWDIIKIITKVASNGALQFLIGSASWILMVKIVASFGSEAMAGYQVAIRIFLFFLLPAWGMSNAAATLVGQNLGAQQPGRAESSVWVAIRYNSVFMVCVTILFVVGASQIVHFMNKDPAVEKTSIQALHILSAGYIVYGIGMVFNNTFNGAGDTRTPTIINLCCFWGFQIPVAYLLAIRLGFGPTGVFYAILLTETVVTITAFLLFKRGSWKRVKI